ncbi:DnaJ subfamily C member 17 [Chaetomidium leptoderma]|uniref:DnaJ subfamily C member 17 n=1 Tax=Chaetomidium leptoderma TaxID=669021 RepID=A0AAN6ZXW4_9PEZI|nr:DnaJ subfamily C member 17 [Chaetomidium leptoderma]
MADQDIVAYARDAASRGDDLFALLATDATASESDIRRAFRRKALTAHPDKAGDAYDPALYERIERARDVLVTPEAREAYDNGMRAILQKKMQLDQMSQKRRQLVEDLERREAAAKRAKMGPAAPVHDPERAALAARGRAKMEEMRRLREEAEAREQLAKQKDASAAADGPPVASTDKPAAPSQPPVASTDKPVAAQTPQDGEPTPQATDGDYDKRIAELEKRLEESRQRKAEKRQRKAEKKAKSSRTPAAPRSPERETPDNPPPPPTTAEPQADEDKVSQPAGAAASAAASSASSQPKASDRFASTLARLREAQAKKNEEKRRKAEEAQAAGVSMP